MNEFSMRRSWGPKPNYERVINYTHPHHNFTIVAGPCSVEGYVQINEVAKHVANNGATHLRGGLYRTGTYPGKSFGWVDEGLIAEHQKAANANGLKNIIEILDYTTGSLDMILQYADCLQVGCRQMQNYRLLRTLGAQGKPVFLKRNPGATVDEWLGAAEHVLSSGCKELYLIERGSSTHMNHVRWDLSISVIPAIASICKIPVIVDGSHGTGRRDLVAPMTLAGVAAGARGCLVETHPDPVNSLSDSDQAISFGDFSRLMKRVKSIEAVNHEEHNNSMSYL